MQFKVNINWCARRYAVAIWMALTGSALIFLEQIIDSTYSRHLLQYIKPETKWQPWMTWHTQKLQRQEKVRATHKTTDVLQVLRCIKQQCEFLTQDAARNSTLYFHYEQCSVSKSVVTENTMNFTTPKMSTTI